MIFAYPNPVSVKSARIGDDLVNLLVLYQIQQLVSTAVPDNAKAVSFEPIH